MKKQTQKTIYRAVYDGICSTIEEIAPDHYSYEDALQTLESPYNEEYFFSRPKAVKALKATIKDRIQVLQDQLKIIK
jgi:hypothetical protein